MIIKLKNLEGLMYCRNSFYHKWLIDYKGTLKGIHLRKHDMKATNTTRKLHYINHHDVHITWVNIEVYTKMRSLRVIPLFTLKDIKDIMEVWGLHLSGHFQTFMLMCKRWIIIRKRYCYLSLMILDWLLSKMVMMKY